MSPEETVQSKAYDFAPAHLDYLTKRAIDPQLAYVEGVRSVDEDGARSLTGNAIIIGGGLAFPYDNRGLPADFPRASYTRVQLDDRAANDAKTNVASGITPPPYLLSTTTAVTSSTIFIVEGPPKALALASNGWADAIALGGVSAGFFLKGSKSIQPQLLPFFPKGREVLIAFDAGRATSAQVAGAEAKIARCLLDLGCTVRLVELPLHEGADQGPDDFLARFGREAFAKLVVAARLADPVEYAKVAALDPPKARTLLEDITFCSSVALCGPKVHKEIAQALAAYYQPKAIKDAYANHPIVQAYKAKAQQPGPTITIGGQWEKAFERSSEGEILGCTANVQLVLENDPRWTCIAFNLLENDIVFERPPSATEFLLHKPGSKWVDADDVSLSTWLHRTWKINYPYYSVRAIAALAAHRRDFCPIQRRLSDLKWDGKPRVDSWLTAYLGVEASEYSRLVGRLWLISAVARIFTPGCQVDYVLTLEGEQRIGKSSALRVLALDDAFFTDSIKSVDDIKKVGEQIAGKWIIELAELAAIKRADLEPVKAFITRRVDRYRPSYGRSSMDFPRRCVLAATVNRVGEIGYLRDASGNERWWPVLCSRIDCDGLARERDQVWAEAVALYQAGERWYPEKHQRDKLFVPQQDERREVDGWEDSIRRHLLRVEHWTTTERLLVNVIQLPIERHDQIAVKRVAQILHVLGWESYREEKVDEKGEAVQPRVRIRAWRRTPKADPFMAKPVDESELKAADFAGSIPICTVKPEDLLQ